MRVERPTGKEPTFKWTLNKKQAALIKSLPKDEIDRFNKMMMDAPMDASKQSSNVRDSILKSALKLARKLRKGTNGIQNNS